MKNKMKRVAAFATTISFLCNFVVAEPIIKGTVRNDNEIKNERRISEEEKTIKIKECIIYLKSEENLKSLLEEMKKPLKVEIVEGEGKLKMNKRTETYSILASFGSSSIPYLLEVIKDKGVDELIKRDAIMITGWMDEKDSISAAPFLLEILKMGGVPEARSTIIYIFGKIRYKEAIPAIRGFLDSDNAYLRAAAICSLGELKDKESVPKLVDLLTDTNDEIAKSAASALGKINDRRAISPLLMFIHGHCRNSPAENIINFEKSYIVWEAIYALGDILKGVVDEPTAIVLLNMLNDDRTWYGYKDEIIMVLGKMKYKGAIPSLLAALNNDYFRIRVSATEALGEIGDKSSIEWLEDALKNEREKKIHPNSYEKDVKNIKNLTPEVEEVETIAMGTFFAGEKDEHEIVERSLRKAIEKLKAKN